MIDRNSQIKEDLKFLEELIERLKTAHEDCVSYEYVEKMLTDWKDELEKLRKVKLNYIVRDWMVSEVHEFTSFKKAEKKYEEILKETAEQQCDCDVQMMLVIKEFCNIKE